MNFFVIVDGGVGSLLETDWDTASDVRYGDAPRCDACGAIIGLREWLPPYRVELVLHGAQWADFAFSPGGVPLASERVVDICRDASITGLEVLEPLEVASARGSKDPPPEYRRLEATRWGATLSEEGSSLLRARPVECDVCLEPSPYAMRGFAIEPGTWTGDDVFTLRGQDALMIATERFVDVARKHDFTNIRFVPTGKFETGLWDPQVFGHNRNAAR